MQGVFLGGSQGREVLDPTCKVSSQVVPKAGRYWTPHARCLPRWFPREGGIGPHMQGVFPGGSKGREVVDPACKVSS